MAKPNQGIAADKNIVRVVWLLFKVNEEQTGKCLAPPNMDMWAASYSHRATFRDKKLHNSVQKPGLDRIHERLNDHVGHCGD